MNSATSNGSPMSGSPFRHVSHRMARAVAASARAMARTSVTRASWRSLVRSNRSSFGDVPLPAAVAGHSDWMGMRTTSPGEASSSARVSRHPSHNVSPFQRQLSENRETGIQVAESGSGSRAGEADSQWAQTAPRRLHAVGGADFGVRLPRRKAPSFRTHRGHDEANRSRSRVDSAPGQDHEPHEHASESAGHASSMTSV